MRLRTRRPVTTGIARLGAVWLLLSACGPVEAADTPTWDRQSARQAAQSVDIDSGLRSLSELSPVDDVAETLNALGALSQRADWPGPARDYALWRYANSLRMNAMGTPDARVLDWLAAFEPQTWVGHQDHPRTNVPLFNIRAVVAGIRHEQRRLQAAADAGEWLANNAPGELITAWLDQGDPAARRGYIDALPLANPPTVSVLAKSLAREMDRQPALAELAGYVALQRGDAHGLARALRALDGPATSQLLYTAAQRWPAAQQAALLLDVLDGPEGQEGPDRPDDDHARLAALSIAQLGPGARSSAKAVTRLESLLDDPLLGATAKLALAAQHEQVTKVTPSPGTQSNHNGTLAEWVETNPGNDPARIALGYPPPIPVETPLPFDGFRSYAGLHVRHQALADDTPWVHPHVIGTTHKGRSIWAYRLGDGDLETPWGLPEPATLTNGGIHAREWSTPEVVTGILEQLATAPADGHIHDYLRDSVNAVVIPVLNVDGFQQTQRYPTQNYLDSDPDFPDSSPRDGRMRRKNLLDADQDLLTDADHLGGVDLNRNNPPYWAGNSQRSSYDPDSLVYHGSGPASEPETQALHAAPGLGPENRLRMYTDVHSYSQVHFWSRLGDGSRLATQTQSLLRMFSNHHQAFAAGKRYHYAFSANVPVNRGIGATDEYFMSTYRIPAWTLETEPTGGQPYHQPLPGGGGDYGGTGVNVHDGFILPESEVRRVREELAQTFVAAYYRQSGPPAIQVARVLDGATGATVFEAQWTVTSPHSRDLFREQLEILVPGREYQLWLGFNKPMRWLDDNGMATALQGHISSAYQDVDIELLAGDTPLGIDWGDAAWIVTPPGATEGYLRYRTDAYAIPFTITDSVENTALLDSPVDATLRVRAWDMTYQGLDGDPATVVDWFDGHWVRYEDTFDNESDIGGWDDSLTMRVQAGGAAEPFTLEPGIASAWYDPEHDGEGFIIEMLSGGQAVLYWFTYDESGNQDWYIGAGQQRGNRLVFDALTQTSGGVFGEDFDPAQVTRETVGQVGFLFSGCDNGHVDWHIGNRQGRQAIQRVTHLQGLDCGPPLAAPVRQESQYSGAWYDPAHDGEGFTVQVLGGDQVVVYWFSFDPEGKRRWIFGLGGIVDGRFEFAEMLTSRGGVFGDDFDPATVEYLPWGTLTLELGCDGGTASWTSTEPGFAPGTLSLQQLTRMDGLECAPAR
ncbi:hypothetical protein F3N42_08160 [Marinihelvus fidelis]|uniref:Peptidase M14 domain-containing protein n=1 Tax=Marinihelvus fidelis TaxID=2613842 RepID=A0A5N0T8N5_9GAMM|nr:M14 family zinc carboxypeptidase [Marinihelvus fidelis]KAA9131292.1 hypothetical protein F3N42_08160 [Marinihelvus fidelis]